MKASKIHVVHPHLKRLDFLLRLTRSWEEQKYDHHDGNYNNDDRKDGKVDGNFFLPDLHDGRSVSLFDL